MGKNNNTTIEINGKRYDAHTGAPIEPAVSPLHRPRNVDGVIKSKKVNDQQPHSVPIDMPTQPQPAVALKHPTMQDVTRRPAAKLKGHAPQSSQTLMRHVVKKPPASFKRHVKAQTGAGALAQQAAHTVTTKPSVAAIKPARAQLAKKIPKSQAISRFGSLHSAPASQQPPVPTFVPERRIIPQPAQQTPTTTADMLEHALQAATSHKQTSPKKSRFRISRPVMAVSLSVVVSGLLFGFVAIQNLPDIKMQLASAKAGFSASLPAYHPAGYHMGSIEQAPGVVSVQYRSNSDDRSFTLTEKTSAWNSATLRDNFVASNAKTYQTVETGGRTIYLYGQNQASWVNGGIWYQVQSNGALSNHQLVELATSL